MADSVLENVRARALAILAAGVAIAGCGEHGHHHYHATVDIPFQLDAAGPPPTDAGPPPTDAGAPPSDAGPDCSAWERFDHGLVGGTVLWTGWDPRDRSVAWATIPGAVFRGDSTEWVRVAAPGVDFTDVALPHDASVDILAASADGIWRSEDDGITWARGSLSGIQVRDIEVSPADSRVVYAVAASPGVFRSNDRGATWASSGIGLGAGEVLTISADPREARTLVVGGAELNPSGGWSDRGFVAVSTDGGVTFEIVFTEPGRSRSLARCAANPDVLYSGHIYGIGRSDDGGRTWTRIAPPIFGDAHVRVGGATCDDVLVSLGGSLYRSDDGGHSWIGPIREGFEFAPTYAPGLLDVHPDADGRVLAATHAGLYTSDDGGRSWHLQPGVGVPRVRRVDESVARPGRLLLAGWGSGAWMRDPEDAAWVRVGSQTDFVYSVHESEAETLFVAANGLHRREPDAASFTLSIPHGATFAVGTDPRDPTRVWAVTQTRGILRSDDSGATFAPANGDLVAWPTAAGTFIDVRAVLVLESGRVLVGTHGAGLRYSDDEGASWEIAAGVSETESVSCLVRTDVGIMACTGGSGLFESEDGAAWSSISDGLDGLEIVGAAWDPIGRAAYAVTTGGVFVRTGTEWTRFDAECAPTAVGPPMVATMASGGSALILPVADSVLVRRSLP